MNIFKMVSATLFVLVALVACISKEGAPCINNVDCPQGMYCNTDNTIYDEQDGKWYGECVYIKENNDTCDTDDTD